MKKSELMKLVGKKVSIQLYDHDFETGILKYVDEFSRKCGYRNVDSFYINKIEFKASHIKKLKVEE